MTSLAQSGNALGEVRNVVGCGMSGFGKEPTDCDIFLRRRPVLDTVQGFVFPTVAKKGQAPHLVRGDGFFVSDFNDLIGLTIAQRLPGVNVLAPSPPSIA